MKETYFEGLKKYISFLTTSFVKTGMIVFPAKVRARIHLALNTSRSQKTEYSNAGSQALAIFQTKHKNCHYLVCFYSFTYHKKKKKSLRKLTVANLFTEAKSARVSLDALQHIGPKISTPSKSLYNSHTRLLSAIFR